SDTALAHHPTRRTSELRLFATFDTPAHGTIEASPTVRERGLPAMASSAASPALPAAPIGRAEASVLQPGSNVLDPGRLACLKARSEEHTSELQYRSHLV